MHRWGASVVEFHLDLDGKGAEYAAGHCWLPHEIAPVIARIREGERADGTGFKEPVRRRAFRPRMARRSGRWLAPAAPHPRAMETRRMSETAKRPRVVAIVQARMGSTRLPGKVLRPIAGKPLLWHVVHRLRRATTLDAILIATSTNPRDDAICAFCREEGIEWVRGPEDNVLARFALAAEASRADVIVRVSSDAPLLDAAFIDHLVEALIAQDGDYVLLEPGALCAHEGVDPFSRRALDKLVSEAAHDPVAREHVTGYFKLHPGFRAHRPCRALCEAGTQVRAPHHRYAGRSRLHRDVARPP